MRKKFGLLAPTALIQKYLRIDGHRNIFIEDNALVQKLTWLAAVPISPNTLCKLIIEQGAVVGNFNHIYCTQSITIKKNALLADKVYIADNLHGYDDISQAIKNQPLKQLKSVTIGEGAWIGENVCIIGANVGRGSVIGAGAIVTHDIPDFSVAVGVPAKVIKQFNHTTQSWQAV